MLDLRTRRAPELPDFTQLAEDLYQGGNGIMLEVDHLERVWEMYHRPAFQPLRKIGRIRAENRVLCDILWNRGR